MKVWILVAPALAFALMACEEKAEEPSAPEEDFGNYKAIGTEPGWTVDITDGQIDFSSQEGKKFTLPVDQAKKTATGWEVRGYSDTENINLSITSDTECSDGMSDREYADTVTVRAGGFGEQNGCGGDFTEGENGAP